MAFKTYNMGICSEKYKRTTINNALERINLSVNRIVIKDLESESIHMMDTLFLINPNFTPNQKTAFLDYIQAAGTAVYTLSLDISSANVSSSYLSMFNISFKPSRKTKKLIVEYLSDYPQPYKRNRKEMSKGKNSKKLLFLKS